MLFEEIPPGMPAGTPVSRALVFQHGYYDLGPLRHAVAMVDAVHGDGRLTSIPIGILPMEKHVGVFSQRRKNELPEGICVDPRAREPDMVAVHEIGHFVDFAALGSGQRFASEVSSPLQRWRSEIRRSVAYQELVRNQHYRSAYCTLPNGHSVNVPLDQEFVQYTLEFPELFARSYTQYVVLKSCDGVLQEQLERVRSQPIHQVYPLQWEDAEFESIAQAIDQVFRQKGWIV